MRGRVGKTAPPLKTHHNTGMGMKGGRGTRTAVGRYVPLNI